MEALKEKDCESETSENSRPHNENGAVKTCHYCNIKGRFAKDGTKIIAD